MSRGGDLARSVPTITTSPVTAEVAREWSRHSRPGDELVYFSGCGLFGALPVVQEARRLHTAGKVTLFQRRRGPAQFDYCMKKCAATEVSGPLSCGQLRLGMRQVMESDKHDLLMVLKRLANAGHPCPSDARLADLADLKNRESARYRMVQLHLDGFIDVTTSPSGTRIVTIRETGARTRGQ